MSRRILATIVLVLIFVWSCTDGSKPADQARPVLPKDKPQNLEFDVLAVLLQDMHEFSTAVKSLNQKRLQDLDARYKGVLFQTERNPLVLNVYRDPAAGGNVIFLVTPKDPQTGANFLLTFDRDLPVIKEPTVELQMRLPRPEEPLQCTLPIANPEEYLNQYRNHKFTVKFTLEKRFLQSGTYDFDALTVPSYRSRGYAFVVFDLVKAELLDQDAQLTAPCRF